MTRLFFTILSVMSCGTVLIVIFDGQMHPVGPGGWFSLAVFALVALTSALLANAWKEKP